MNLYTTILVHLEEKYLLRCDSTWPLPCSRAHILPLPKKGVADLCLQLVTIYVQMHVHQVTLRIALDTYNY